MDTYNWCRFTTILSSNTFNLNEEIFKISITDN